MKKFIFLNNVFTPYRTAFFNALYKSGFNFTVYYMREAEADRNWTMDYSEVKHPYYVDRGLYKMMGRFHIHFNPRLILKMLKAKDTEFILGGSWNHLDVLALIILKRLGILRNQIHFWSEANYLTIGALKDNIFKERLRKFVFNSSNGALIIPGKMSEITFERWGIKNKKFIDLPNTIEEDKFQITENEIALRYENDIPVFLMPVRLVEKVKGIVNFFKAIGADNIRRGLFLIAGDGPDKGLIEKFIREQEVEENIKLLGFCNTEELTSLYKKANIFFLPSFSDPSPLTLVEALSMKLPVLISERCGNHYEAIIDEKNGYLFDPADASSIKRAFEALMLRADEWKSMGELSGELYYKKFYKKLVTDKFIRNMNGSF
jgi:glycosyltransferase involved in cell wall biosynthesis